MNAGNGFKSIIIMLMLSAGCIVSVRAGVTGQKDNPNVILIIIDSLRADRLGCYGYRKETSPAIDDLARNSLVFTNAFSTSGYTLPSVMSMLTAVYPRSHGMWDINKDTLPPSIRTLAEVLKSSGYETAWASRLHESSLDIDIGFGRGFDTTIELDRELRSVGEITSWIYSRKNTRFFLAIQTRTLHFPYFPPGAYREKMAEGDKKLIPVSDEELDRNYYKRLKEYISKRLPAGIQNGSAVKLPEDEYTPERLDQLIQSVPFSNPYLLDSMKMDLYRSLINKADGENVKYYASLYDACVLWIDQELIRPLVSFLKDRDLLGRSIIIITSDHGTEFMDHGDLGPGFKTYDELIHIPLIISLPGQGKSGRLSALAQSIDIFPTLCEITKTELPRYAQGKSLMPLLNGSIPAVRDYVFCDTPVESCIRSDRWKLVIPHRDYPQRRRLLFDLERDPAEQKNLYDSAGEPALLKTRMSRALREWYDSLEVFKKHENDFPPGMDPETKERIRKTGYW